MQMCEEERRCLGGGGIWVPTWAESSTGIQQQAQPDDTEAQKHADLTKVSLHQD